MTAQVHNAASRLPTIPAWFSEMLPLNFDLAMEINTLRRLMEEKFKEKKSREEIIAFINKYLYIDALAAESLYHYFREQYEYVGEIPSDKKIVIEHYIDEHDNKYVIFHTLF